jgi:hypothetical protein
LQAAALLLMVAPLVALAAVAFIIWLPLHLLWTGLLYLIVWISWLPRGRSILFVTSNSPVWQPYLEANVFPHIRDRAVFLNWSERKRWPLFSLRVILFHHFAGPREFNPAAIVFRLFRRAQVLRLYKPFRAFKHGDTMEVEKLTAEVVRIRTT